MQPLFLQIDTLIEKAGRMHQLIHALLQERDLLENRIEELEQEIKQYKQSLTNESQQTHNNSQGGFTPTEKAQLKATIENYLKEIDNCLKQLGE